MMAARRNRVKNIETSPFPFKVKSKTSLFPFNNFTTPQTAEFCFSMPSKEKTIIVLAGPTAVGKTAAAIEIAKWLGTEIISADSRQCYQEMNIGVARPAPEELASVKHYFIASHSIHQKVTAATFEVYALEKAAQIFEKHQAAVMVGGTGLYIKAFCEGLDAIPEIPDTIRNKMVADYNKNGLAWLQQQVAERDPVYFESGEKENPHRLMRALEVIQATGKSILFFRKGAKAERPFNIIKLGLQLPKENLHQRIHSRVDKMMEEGLLEEVKALQPYQHLQALQTVGYRELFEYLKGEKTLPQAIEEIKKNTRHYAKRQMTWFKKDTTYNWFEPQQLDAIKSTIQSNLP